MKFPNGVSRVKKEETWGIKVVVEVLEAGRGRCTRQSARSVKKNAKFPLSLT
jgi:hypothetical protein